MLESTTLPHTTNYHGFLRVHRLVHSHDAPSGTIQGLLTFSSTSSTVSCPHGAGEDPCIDKKACESDIRYRQPGYVCCRINKGCRIDSIIK
jgi:hypothetical protein